MTEKTCANCGTEKPVELFHRDKRRKDGRFPYCKECMRARSRDWYSRRSQDSEYMEERNKRMRKSTRRWHADPINQAKKKAHKAVRTALERGEIERKPCEKCGALPTDAHHEDYSRPLDVMWLCRSCHSLHHKE